MHSASVYSVLSTAALFAFTNAVPTPKQINGIARPGQFELHCDLPKGRFDGYCSVDPCGRMDWCPDYLDGTYVLKNVIVDPPKNTTITCTGCHPGHVTTPTPSCSSHPPKVTTSCTSSAPSVTVSHSCSTSSTPSCSTSTTSSCTTSTTSSCTTHPSGPAHPPPPPPKDECHCEDNNSKETEHYHKRSNIGTPPPGKSEYHCQLPLGHFDGFCSVDPCGRFDWCPDYAPGQTTIEKDTPPAKDPVDPVVSSSPKYYRCSNNGFAGVCSVDPCALEWCPDYPKPMKPTDEMKPAPVPVEQKLKQFYVCSNSGFRGMCSVDPCAISWCPDYVSGTYNPIVKSE